jgi:hypothetical protein
MGPLSALVQLPMKKKDFRGIEEFKEFVYGPSEGHYFFFCETHRNLLERKQDIVESITNIGEVCDHPKCRVKAGYVFFPNLYTVVKRNQ